MSDTHALVSVYAAPLRPGSSRARLDRNAWVLLTRSGANITAATVAYPSPGIESNAYEFGHIFSYDETNKRIWYLTEHSGRRQDSDVHLRYAVYDENAGTVSFSRGGWLGGSQTNATILPDPYTTGASTAMKPFGMFNDGTTIWIGVVPERIEPETSRAGKMFIAYNMATGDRERGKDITDADLAENVQESHYDPATNRIFSWTSESRLLEWSSDETSSTTTPSGGITITANTVDSSLTVSQGDRGTWDMSRWFNVSPADVSVNYSVSLVGGDHAPILQQSGSQLAYTVPDNSSGEYSLLVTASADEDYNKRAVRTIPIKVRVGTITAVPAPLGTYQIATFRGGAKTITLPGQGGLRIWEGHLFETDPTGVDLQYTFTPLVGSSGISFIDISSGTGNRTYLMQTESTTRLGYHSVTLTASLVDDPTQSAQVVLEIYVAESISTVKVIASTYRSSIPIELANGNSLSAALVSSDISGGSIFLNTNAALNLGFSYTITPATTNLNIAIDREQGVTRAYLYRNGGTNGDTFTVNITATPDTTFPGASALRPVTWTRQVRFV